MNRENLLRVADVIEKHEIEGVGFNMANWFSNMGYPDNSGHYCGTTACIGGFADAIRLRTNDVAKVNASRLEDTLAWLGFTEDQGDKMLFSGPTGVWLENVTLRQAINVLRHAAEHGVIDWDAAQTEAAS